MKCTIINKLTGKPVLVYEGNFELSDMELKKRCGILPESAEDQQKGRLINGVLVPFEDLIINRPACAVTVTPRKATEEEIRELGSDAQLREHLEENGEIPKGRPRFY